MRSEDEIKDKLVYYQRLLMALRVAKAIDNPEVFLQLSDFFPGQVIELLRGSVAIDRFTAEMPAEDGDLFREMLSQHFVIGEQLIKARIAILKWVLEIDG